MGTQVNAIQLDGFHLAPEAMFYNPEMIHLVNPEPAKVKAISRALDEKVHFSRMAQQMLAHDHSTNLDAFSRSADDHYTHSHRHPVAEKSRNSGAKADPALFEELKKMEQKAFEAPEKDSSDPGIDEHAHHQHHRREAVPECKIASFDTEEAQALCRGFLSLGFKWLGEEKAAALTKHVFPAKDPRKKTKFIDGLYNDKIPVDPEYAGQVAVNIVGLLRRCNPYADLCSTIDLMILVGKKEKHHYLQQPQLEPQPVFKNKPLFIDEV